MSGNKPNPETPAAASTPAADATAAAATATAVGEAAAKPVEAAAKPAEPAKPADPPVVDPAKPDAKPAEAKPVEAAKPADKPAEPVVPEKYDLKIPEKSVLSAEHVQKVEAFAKEAKLTNEQAQVLLQRESDAAQVGIDSLHNEAKTKAAQWLKDAQADKEIGGERFAETVDSANHALEALFPGIEIRKIMDTSGLGNHPTVLKGFAKIGAMLKNDKIHPTGNPPPQKPPLTQRLYDNPTSPK